MRIKQNVGPIKIFGSDGEREHFCNIESGRWLNIIDSNYGHGISVRLQAIMIELLENALIKNTHNESNIEYEIEISSCMASLCVRNMVSEQQKYYLFGRMERYNNCDDLLKEYAEVMVENDEGGLGLLRLMIEQECELSINEIENGYIEIKARIKL